MTLITSLLTVMRYLVCNTFWKSLLQFKVSKKMQILLEKAKQVADGNTKAILPKQRKKGRLQEEDLPTLAKMLHGSTNANTVATDFIAEIKKKRPLDENGTQISIIFSFGLLISDSFYFYFQCLLLRPLILWSGKLPFMKDARRLERSCGWWLRKSRKNSGLNSPQLSITSPRSGSLKLHPPRKNLNMLAIPLLSRSLTWTNFCSDSLLIHFLTKKYSSSFHFLFFHFKFFFLIWNKEIVWIAVSEGPTRFRFIFCAGNNNTLVSLPKMSHPVRKNYF